MMYFRRLYWVVEKRNGKGASEVFGVYTSIPDLTDKGLPAFRQRYPEEGLRLSLIKLDSQDKPLGCWSSPEYPGLDEDLVPYIKTGEFTAEECRTLIDLLRNKYASLA
jgi:hypothetical protein